MEAVPANERRSEEYAQIDGPRQGCLIATALSGGCDQNGLRSNKPLQSIGRGLAIEP
jgi:hypothetical protein